MRKYTLLLIHVIYPSIHKRPRSGYVGVPNAYFVAPWGRGGHPVYTQSPALKVQSNGVQHFVNARDEPGGSVDLAVIPFESTSRRIGLSHCCTRDNRLPVLWNYTEIPDWESLWRHTVTCPITGFSELVITIKIR